LRPIKEILMTDLTNARTGRLAGKVALITGAVPGPGRRDRHGDGA
jgi:hypothetical protein